MLSIRGQADEKQTSKKRRGLKTGPSENARGGESDGRSGYSSMNRLPPREDQVLAMLTRTAGSSIRHRHHNSRNATRNTSPNDELRLGLVGPLRRRLEHPLPSCDGGRWRGRYLRVDGAGRLWDVIEGVVGRVGIGVDGVGGVSAGEGDASVVKVGVGPDRLLHKDFLADVGVEGLDQ